MSNFNSLDRLAIKHPINAAKAILTPFLPMGIDCAYSLCQLLNCETEVFLWQNKRTTMEQLVVHYSPSADLTKIHIKFYGGPIGRGSWHTGNILTFLLDHIANNVIMEGYLKTKARILDSY